MPLPGLDNLIGMVTGKGGRSTVLIELRWLCGFLTTAFVVAASAKANTWICVCLFVLVCFSVIAMVGGWCYWSWKKVDVLRTEHFILRQREIEVMGSKDNPQFIDAIAERIDSPTDPPATNTALPALQSPDVAEG
jgi:hypothetical protein